MTCEPNNPIIFPDFTAPDVEIGSTTSGKIYLSLINTDGATSICVDRSMAIRIRDNLNRAIGESS